MSRKFWLLIKLTFFENINELFIFFIMNCLFMLFAHPILLVHNIYQLSQILINVQRHILKSIS